jgi:aspartate kinase
VEHVVRQLGAAGYSHDDNVSKISVVGLGMARQTGVAERMFRQLAQADVNILMITTSEIKISVLVARDQAALALRTVHEAFQLEREPDRSPGGETPRSDRHKADAAAVIARLQGMEDLTISDISLDGTQARVSISGVPDSPGVAASVFEEVAAVGIFVDMIVQSFAFSERANLSFTVPQKELPKALEVANKLTGQFRCGPVTHAPRVAKLSVSGIGLRSHTGVAVRMFGSLAEAGINVEMINTSEVRVNVVVSGDSGAPGLAALQKAFEDVQR